MKKVLTLSFLLIFLAFSCQSPKEDIGELGQKSINQGNFSAARKPNTSDEMLELIGLVVSNIIKDKEIRKFIKDEASRKIDGDFNIPFYFAKDTKVPGKGVFREIFVDKMQQIFGSSILAQDQLKKIEDGIPLLNISVPVHIDKWDADNFTPLVAIVPFNFEEKTHKKVKAFDIEGNIYWLDSTKEPDQPVIVIGQNERMILEEDGKWKLNKALVNPEKPQEKKRNMRTSTTCSFPQRGDNEYLYITGMSSDDISHYEAWVNGAPEIWLRVYAPSNGTNFASLGKIREMGENGDWEPSTRSKINGGQWWRVNQSITYWESATYGGTLSFSFMEVDWGDFSQDVNISGNFKVTIPGIGETTRNLGTVFKIRNHDDHIGTITVDQYACPPMSWFNFWYYDVSPHFQMTLNPYVVSYAQW